MAKSQTNYATNDANRLGNYGAGLTDQVQPMVGSYLGGLGGAQAQQQGTLNTLFPALQQNLTTGGYDPNALAGLRSTFQNLSNTGGYDPSQSADIMGGYKNLADTGGFNPQQEQDFIRQATEGTQATYGALQNRAKQASVATGGLGTTGAISQMTRQLSQEQGRETLNAKVGLNQLETSNKLSGLGGEAGFSTAVAGGRRAGASGLAGLESDVAGGGRQTAGQLGNLFNTQTGQVTAMGDQLLKTLGISYSSQAEAAQILQGLSKNPGAFQTAIGDIIGLGGAAAGAASGLGVRV